MVSEFYSDFVSCIGKSKNILRHIPKGLCIFAETNIGEHSSHSHPHHHMKFKVTNSSLYIGAEKKELHYPGRHY